MLFWKLSWSFTVIDALYLGRFSERFFRKHKEEKRNNLQAFIQQGKK